MTQASLPDRAPERAAPSRPVRQRHAWIQPADVRTLRAALGSGSLMSDNDKPLVRLLDELQRDGLIRTVVVPPDPKVLLGLCRQWPNFRDVVLFVAGHAALLGSPGAAPVALPPLLLAGPPGIGKTSFASALAQVLGVPFRTLPMSSLTAGFGLAGLDRGWSTGRPGELFELMRRHEAANPLLVLDEIDKANQDPKSSPVGPLYQLLEPATAATFVDEYVGLPMDLRMVSWMATANDEAAVPEALRSRLTVFHIEPPTAAQMHEIVQGQYARLQSSTPSLREPLPATVLDRLVRLAPRTAGRQLQEAAGRAALRCRIAGREHITIVPADLPPSPRLARPAGFF